MYLNELNNQIIECRSQLSIVCPSVLLRSICTKIQALNSKLFNHLKQTKNNKLEKLTNPQENRATPLENQNQNTVVTILENLPLSDAEKCVLSKGLHFVPITKTMTNSQRKPIRHYRKRRFETLTFRKSKWSPLEGQLASIDFFIKKCRHDVHKLNFNRNTKLSNLSKEE